MEAGTKDGAGAGSGPGGVDNRDERAGKTANEKTKDNRTYYG